MIKIVHQCPQHRQNTITTVITPCYDFVNNITHGQRHKIQAATNTSAFSLAGTQVTLSIKCSTPSARCSTAVHRFLASPASIMQWGVHHQQHCMLKILNQQHVRKTQHSHRHRPALAPSWQPLLATTCQAADCKGLLTQRSSRVLAPAAAGNSSSSSSSTSTEASNSLAHQPPQQVTCRRCLQRFSVTENSPTACYYHPAMYTGGEVAKVCMHCLWLAQLSSSWYQSHCMCKPLMSHSCPTRLAHSHNECVRKCIRHV